MTKNEELKTDIQVIVKKTVSDLLAEMRRNGMIRETISNPYQKTEQILYNYVKFCSVIADKERTIKFIREGGIQNRSKSITCAPVNGGGLDSKSASEKADDQIASLENSIVVTRRYIKIVDDALEKIVNDPYYPIITMKYFDRCSRESIAEFFCVDVATISRNCTRLIDILKIYLFSDDVILEMFR